jgi:hypothetical protein
MNPEKRLRDFDSSPTCSIGSKNHLPRAFALAHVLITTEKPNINQQRQAKPN